MYQSINFLVDIKIAFVILLITGIFIIPIVNAQDKSIPKWQKCNQKKEQINDTENEIAKLKREYEGLSAAEDKLEQLHRFYSEGNIDLYAARSGRVPKYAQSLNSRQASAKEQGLTWDSSWNQNIIAFLTALRDDYLNKYKEQEKKVKIIQSFYKTIDDKENDLKKYEDELENLDCNNVTFDEDEKKDGIQDKGDNNTISANYLDWTGTWVADNDRIKFIISGDRKEFSISFEYEYPGAYWNEAKGKVKLTNCKIDGNAGTCDWSDAFQTKDYNSSAKGKMKLELNGDRISVSLSEITVADKVSWKGGKELYPIPRHSMLIKDEFNTEFNTLTRQT